MEKHSWKRGETAYSTNYTGMHTQACSLVVIIIIVAAYYTLHTTLRSQVWRANYTYTIIQNGHAL